MKTKFSTVHYHSKLRVVFKNGFSHKVWVKDIIFDADGQIGWEHISDHNEFLEFLPDEILCIIRIKYKKVRKWQILQGLIGLFSNTSSGVKTASSSASNSIKELFSMIGNSIKKVVLGILNVIKAVVLGILNGIKNTFKAIWSNIKKLYVIFRKIRQLITKARRKLFGIR